MNVIGNLVKNLRVKKVTERISLDDLEDRLLKPAGIGLHRMKILGLVCGLARRIGPTVYQNPSARLFRGHHP